MLLHVCLITLFARLKTRTGRASTAPHLLRWQDVNHLIYYYLGEMLEEQLVFTWVCIVYGKRLFLHCYLYTYSLIVVPVRWCDDADNDDVMVVRWNSAERTLSNIDWFLAVHFWHTMRKRFCAVACTWFRWCWYCAVTLTFFRITIMSMTIMWPGSWNAAAACKYLIIVLMCKNVAFNW